MSAAQRVRRRGGMRLLALGAGAGAAGAGVLGAVAVARARRAAPAAAVAGAAGMLALGAGAAVRRRRAAPVAAVSGVLLGAAAAGVAARVRRDVAAAPPGRGPAAAVAGGVALLAAAVPGAVLRRPRTAGPIEPQARSAQGRKQPASPAAQTRAWVELLRVSALFTVPGDALAGAAAAGLRPNRGTALAIGSSLCLYEAGMALNDYADRDVDAVERPHRPLPSGRITPRAALAAAAALTAASLGLAAAAGRRPLALATALAGAVWAYDLKLKNTPAGPAAMAAARTLDLLLGAAATQARAGHGAAPPAGTSSSALRHLQGGDGWADGPLAAAVLLGVHTYAVTVVSRREVEGGSTAVPLVGLAVTTAVAATLRRGNDPHPQPDPHPRADGAPPPGGPRLALTPGDLLAGAYAATAVRPYLHAALNPSPQLTQRAVGGGIRAMIPLQSALAARAGAPGSAAALLALVPVARRLARKVSPT
ncbi:SCO3242 family prenyltransferase [Streptomyces sp. CNQ-509]|uniref:SCO3242 family prenyltransferase n=1 Tax=Streptomyces sp. CNQ-509 TaxID=444103 RepID=UPI00099B355A